MKISLLLLALLVAAATQRVEEV
jgi:hypothetical protein